MMRGRTVKNGVFRDSENDARDHIVLDSIDHHIAKVAFLGSKPTSHTFFFSPCIKRQMA